MNRIEEIRGRHTAFNASLEEVEAGCGQPDSDEISDDFHSHAFADVGYLLTELDRREKRIADLRASIRWAIRNSSLILADGNTASFDEELRRDLAYDDEAAHGS